MKVRQKPRTADYKGFSAITDDPPAIARRALREAKTAIRKKDELGLRQAAEKGWLAVSAAADVAANHMGRKEPGGSNGRRTVLEDLETLTKTRRGTLLNTFEAARTVLHGECFHGSECSSKSVLGLLDAVATMTQDTVTTLAKLRPRRR